jgi:DNA-binding MarR family transcriptional regulator
MDTTTPQAAVDTSREEPWTHYLAHLLWEVAARATVLGEAELAGTPLTFASSGLLQQLGAEPGITIAEVARRLPTSQQAVSQVVARLEKLGYVERRLGSGRGVGLHLTPDGVGARDDGADAEARFDRRLQELFGPERYAQLREGLEAARSRLIDARP